MSISAGMPPELIESWQRAALEIYIEAGLAKDTARHQNVDIDNMVAINPETGFISIAVALPLEHSNLDAMRDSLKACASGGESPPFVTKLLLLAKRCLRERVQETREQAKRAAARTREKYYSEAGFEAGDFKLVGSITEPGETGSYIATHAMRLARTFGGDGPAVVSITYEGENDDEWWIVAMLGSAEPYRTRAPELDSVQMTPDLPEDVARVGHVTAIACRHYHVPMHAIVLVETPDCACASIIEAASITAAFSDRNRKPLVVHGEVLQ